MTNALCVLLIVYAGLTLQRLRVWQNELPLWTDASAKAPLKPRPWINLGAAHAHRGELAAAARSFEQARLTAADRGDHPDEQMQALAIATHDLVYLLSVCLSPDDPRFAFAGTAQAITGDVVGAGPIPVRGGFVSMPLPKTGADRLPDLPCQDPK